MYSFELTYNWIDSPITFLQYFFFTVILVLLFKNNNEQKIHMFFFTFLNQLKYKFLCIGAKNVRYETSNNKMRPRKRMQSINKLN